MVKTEKNNEHECGTDPRRLLDEYRRFFFEYAFFLLILY